MISHVVVVKFWFRIQSKFHKECNESLSFLPNNLMTNRLYKILYLSNVAFGRVTGFVTKGRPPLGEDRQSVLMITPLNTLMRDQIGK